ncbi:MAG: hypothetical protein QM516_08875 [Limnohabitans sp.]|nr:hypothetical protein [Limnohabitans sp.]
MKVAKGLKVAKGMKVPEVERDATAPDTAPDTAVVGASHGAEPTAGNADRK